MADKVKSYHDLRIWRSGIKLVKSIYDLAIKFPKHEIYGLAGQMQRAAVSIPSNIAEGQIRGTDKEFKRFLQIALGSCAELETQLVIAHELKYLNAAEYSTLLEQITEEARQIRALSKQLHH